MKFFYLERIDKTRYDENNAAIVRAKSHKSVRQIMRNRPYGDENRDVWVNPKHSKCKEIKPEGKPQIVLIDFNAG